MPIHAPIRKCPIKNHLTADSIAIIKTELEATLAHAKELADLINEYNYKQSELAKLEKEDLELAACEKRHLNQIALKENELKSLRGSLDAIRTRRQAIFNLYTKIKNG